MSKQNKENWNISLAPLYKTGIGYWSTTLMPNHFDASQAIEVGGKYSITILTEEKRAEMAEEYEAKGKDPANVPYGFIEFIPAKKVAAKKAEWENRSPSRKTANQDL